MDTITSAHGLVPLSTVATNDQVELDSLPLELQLELKRLKDDFNVDSKRLKHIVSQFQEELQAGPHYRHLITHGISRLIRE